MVGGWDVWMMSGDDFYATILAAGVVEEGHHPLKSGHSSVKMIFRRLNEPGKEEVRERVDRTLVWAILTETRRLGVTFEAITGPDTGGLKMARRLAPILSEILGYTVHVIENRKLSNDEFEIIVDESLPSQLTVLVVEDVVTSGGSLRRLLAAMFDLKRLAACGIFAYANRDGQDAKTLGVLCFGAVVDRRLPIYRVEKGKEQLTCPQCRDGIALSPHH